MEATVRKKENIRYCICISLLLVMAIALLIRTFFGMDWSDESLYIANAYRFYQGDMFMVEDWLPTQMASILLLPFMYIYCPFFGMNGIILFFRVLYLLFQTAIAIRVFFFIKRYYVGKFPDIISFVSALLYLTYTKFNIASLSYNTIALGCLLYFVILIYDNQNKINNWKNIFAGILYAIATICSPYMAVFFLIVTIVIIFNKNNNYKKIWLYVTVGIAISLTFFVLWVLGTSSFTDIFKYLPNVLKDPENPAKPVLETLLISFSQFYTLGKARINGLLFILLVSIAWRITRKNVTTERQKWVNVLLWTMFFGLSMLKLQNVDPVFLPIYIAFVALEIMILIEGKRYWLFIGMGIVFGIATTFASNTGLPGTVNCYMLLTVIAIPISMEFLEINRAEEISLRSKFNFSAICVFVLMVGITYLMMVRTRFIDVYREDVLSAQTQQITNGPAKYLYTTETDKEAYDFYYDLLQKDVDESDRVYFTKNIPMLYMFTEAKNGAPTAWRIALTSPVLEKYYHEFPEKFPTYVMVTKGSSPILTHLSKQNPQEGWMIDQLNEKGYQKTEYDYCTVYQLEE
ncbi:MAG: hypothetical protein PHP50_05065 [Lachnospiraceae bacterium]|nr:hypothetical protein [Lachnospiraceae bacterium]